MPDGDSFLPRIQSVFYAVFDETIGPKVVYQVPEGLIAPPITAQPTPIGNGSSPPSPSPEGSSPTPNTSSSSAADLPSRNSSTSLVSPTDFYRRGRQFPSPQKRSMSSQRKLFNFSDISMYVIPPSALCGRLVICSTRHHRIIGFPVELKGRNYRRYYFRYNLCFVFERSADLSCYEPVVRKITRVLKSCEEESGFLSSPETSPQLYSILEQLYEDLNSYSETSIPIDQFNSIELKIFPFYPNPPEVKDWMVPLALINLPKRYEENWDLTMIKVCRYINGVNHVSRIAQLADCDVGLTRQAISHLLYYQVIMTIDIFQYSNMYSLCKSIQWLADEAHVKDECGSYVVKPGTKQIPDWPDLLHLYSRFKTGKSVYEWMGVYDVERLGIDVRRFITFGVIKGFLRRVHRWPFYIAPAQLDYNGFTNSFDPSDSNLIRKRAKSFNGPAALRFPAFTSALSGDLPSAYTPQGSAPFPAMASADSLGHGDSPGPTTGNAAISATHRARRASAAEKVLEQLRNRDIQKSGASGGLHSPRTSWIHYQQKEEPPQSGSTQSSVAHSYASTTTAASVATMKATQDSPSKGAAGSGRDSRRTSFAAPAGPPPSPVLMPKLTLTGSRQRLTHSPSMHFAQGAGSGQGSQQQTSPYPPELIKLLDGDHHTDEIGVRLSVGWPQLEEWLMAVGGGGSNGDFGNVVIIYR